MIDTPTWIDAAASRRTRREAGRGRRRNLPWSAIVEWPSQQDHAESLEESCAAIAQAPTTGLVAQLVGPSARVIRVRDERSGFVVADLTALDHAIVGPWEWDVRALALGLARSTRDRDKASALVREFARAYRSTVLAAAALDAAGGWESITVGPGAREAHDRLVRGKSKGRVAAMALPVTVRGELANRWVKGRVRIARADLPFDTVDVDADSVLRQFAEYREAAPEALGLRLQRYAVVDAVGCSDGGLLVLVAASDVRDRLLMRTVPVRESVWEPHLVDGVLGSDAQRVLLASQVLQVSPDPTLGWSSDARQLRSVIWSQAIEPDPMRTTTPQWLRLREAIALGSVLGRAHARTLDAPALAGYLGGSEGFDRALVTSSLRDRASAVREI